MEDTDIDKETLLVKSLKYYIRKWNDNRRMVDSECKRMNLDGMISVAQLIVDSIEGGLDIPHKRNICGIFLEDKE